MDNQIIPTKTKKDLFGAWLNGFKSKAVVESVFSKKISIKVSSIELELPVYHLPDGQIYIGIMPPTPQELGYGC